MTQPPEETTLQRKIRLRKEAEAKAVQVLSDQYAGLEDTIPEDPFNKSEADADLDRFVDRIDIVEAYIRYIGKMRPKVRQGQTENIMISCPVPGHTDNNPSAWINKQKGTWFCAKCNQGGDTHDLAAFAKSLPVPGYKTDGSFGSLHRQIAKDFGFIPPLRLAGGLTVPVLVEKDEDQTPFSESSVIVPPVVAPETVESAPLASVEPLHPVDEYDAEDETIIFPRLDWKTLIEPDSYLHEYMTAACVDDIPEEYHFFHALMGLGMALGRDVTLFDYAPVYGNLFVCTLGRSGSGKSRAKSYLDSLLAKALPYKEDDPNSKGTKKISAPGSAEMLITHFQKPVPDPSNPKIIAYYAPVRGLIDFNEMSSLLSRANRLGSSLKPTLMQFFDVDNQIGTGSLTHGIKKATDAFASCITSTQPKAIKTLLYESDDASGFMNRWIFVLGTLKKRIAIGGAIVDMTPAVKPLQDILGWASTFRTTDQIEWSQEAADRFTTFFHDVIERNKKDSKNDAILRIDLIIKKLILLFTANERLMVVPKKSVDRAIEMYPYLLAAYGVSSSEVGGNVTIQIQNKIMEYCQTHYTKTLKGLSAAELNRSLWRHGFEITKVKQVLESLTQMGLLEMYQTEGRGRPTVKYRYVDSK